MRQLLSLLCIVIGVAACSGGAAPTPVPPQKVGVVIDTGTENDKSFNEYTLKGAREAAEEAGLEFEYIGSQSRTDYDRNIEELIESGADMIITVGFQQGDATAKAAQKYPDLTFAIVDNAYFPGFGCPETVDDCYSEAGGLSNVTSLMFAEDEVGYLAGVLAGCVSESGTIASVAGMEIPPVVRFVTGYQNGAKSVDPDIVTLNQYIPDFNDPDTGEVIAQDFISQGADVIFGVGGNTGNGALLAAHEAGISAIGVDVDQYYTYPEVQESLISSAMKNVDVAAYAAVKDFAAGQLGSGIRIANLSSAGVGLAPFHDWEERVSQECRDKIQAAKDALKADSAVTGAK